MQKILGWALLAFLVFFVITNPVGAAHTAKHLGAGLAIAAAGLGSFVTALGGGK